MTVTALGTEKREHGLEVHGVVDLVFVKERREEKNEIEERRRGGKHNDGISDSSEIESIRAKKR